MLAILSKLCVKKQHRFITWLPALLYGLNFATHAHTLPVCTDNRGTALSATSLLGLSYILDIKIYDYMHKYAITM